MTLSLPIGAFIKRTIAHISNMGAAALGCIHPVHHRAKLLKLALARMMGASEEEDEDEDED
jgi:hypothetical protein